MEISIFGLGYICISAACLVTDGRNMFKVSPNYAEVDLINRGNSPVVVTKNLPEYANVRQRFYPNQVVIGSVRNEDALVGERYYAIAS
ncbi:MAG: hypothetical protein PSU93_15845 [Methylobacter sp.]|uniref:UDP-glucose/GDP-mannose dehydrogenase N-terminal domain-containing protein n=1 Tax=Candidatus Methylobacter titanis TaxID=3053457 RepID=A0AA43QA50_9GAMM|nr:hypothetical protein [Candidatus Methylobacter titanis]